MSGEPRAPHATENNNNFLPTAASSLLPPPPSTSNSWVSFSTSKGGGSRFSQKPIPPSPQHKPQEHGLLSRIFRPDVGWRPSTLKLPFHLTFMAITVASIVAIELLLDLSLSHGAVTFSPPSSVASMLDFGPLAFGVIYSFIWASADHDVKRYAFYSCPSLMRCSHDIYIRVRVYRL